MVCFIGSFFNVCCRRQQGEEVTVGGIVHSSVKATPKPPTWLSPKMTLMATRVVFARQVSENKHRPKMAVKLGFMMEVQMMMMGSYGWQTFFSPGSLSL